METETQYKPEILEKRRKYVRYKGKVKFYQKIAIALSVLLLGLAYLLAITIRGNLTMSKQLANKVLTSR